MPAAPSPTKPLRPLSIDVVSIQSQVVYGHVGNSVAVPSLQAHGLSVAAVPTVLLSNTPHYPSLHGGAVPDAWLSGWLADLVARDCLGKLRLIQLGYLGGVSQAGILAGWIRDRLIEAPARRVHIDPVIGDHDHGIYVDPALVPVYRERLAPLAHGLLPNGFELALLTGLPVASMDEVRTAARSLLGEHTEWVIVTSAAPATWPPGKMRVMVVSAAGDTVIEHACVDAAPKGTGDLFSATVSAALLAGQSLHAAAQAACDTVTAAVTRTHRQHCAELLFRPPAG